MRICFCVHRLPYPPQSGGKMETFRLIEGLSERDHDVTVVSYCNDPELAMEMETETGCTVRTVPGSPNRTYRNLFRNVFSSQPLPVMKARTDEYRAEVHSCLPKADILHLHALQTSFLASDLDTRVPTVIRFNNVKSEIYKQFSDYSSNPAKSVYAYLQYLKTKRYEGVIPAQSTLSLTITPEDKGRLESYGARGNIEVLPAGVDPVRFATSDSDPDKRLITFFGSMDYHPNEDAAVWFTNKIFPQIRDEDQTTMLEIVGKNPSGAVSSLGELENVRVTGFVDDISEHVARASVVVIPIRVGTGVRMKVLHAMAMGKPIVSTTVGLQGIEAVDGQHTAIADTEQEFAAKVNELLAKPDLQERYARNARNLIEENHNWSTILTKLEGYYRRLTTDELG